MILMESARCMWEVMAGVIPGTPMPEYTKRWGLTSREWEAIQKNDRPDNDFNERMEVAVSYAIKLQQKTMGTSGEILFEEVENMRKAQELANEYAMGLMSRPDLVNWVKIEWIWF